MTDVLRTSDANDYYVEGGNVQLFQVQPIRKDIIVVTFAAASPLIALRL